MKYEFDVLAALIQYKYPDMKVIVNATGISERKVLSVLRHLKTDLGMTIEKITTHTKTYFYIHSWGVFESGAELQKQLMHLDLVKSKAARLITGKKRKPLFHSFADKKAYSDSVKMQNYRESMRLEGIHPVTFNPEQDKQQLKIKKEALIKFYTTKAQEQLRHVG